MSLPSRADQLFAVYQSQIHRRTDRMFAWLMVLQWLAGIAFAVWVSPYAWDGASSRVHLHVWAAVLLGGAISLFPALLAVLRPGLPSTRYTIAVAQMLMGALLIHLTGGRIETHFHVFGSLAFLAFYRDWRVLIPATVVVALDHMLRGAFWPQSVYGVFVASQWRWVEHAAWVVFEDIVLVMACRASVDDMRERAERTAALERNTDELRVAHQKAEAATRAKSDFLASMSHELRTPLNAIILYSELLEEEAQERGEDNVADLQKIQSAGRQLLELINGILDLSKIEAGKMVLSLETFELRAMLDDVAGMVQPLVEKNANALIVNCPDTIGTMHADVMHVRQILLNLLSNAAKFTSEGSIILSARAVDAAGRDSVELVVADTGVGMTSEQAGKVFEAFTQADVTTTRKYGGTGLGLALVSRFCRLLGGSVAVDSRVGRGSRFTVRLPRRVDEAAPETAGETEAA
jgi:signal transduction histidine kinase